VFLFRGLDILISCFSCSGVTITPIEGPRAGRSLERSRQRNNREAGPILAWDAPCEAGSRNAVLVAVQITGEAGRASGCRQ
jgi:hypothetical protein